jgi:hypothetical protein
MRRSNAAVAAALFPRPPSALVERRKARYVPLLSDVLVD